MSRGKQPCPGTHRSAIRGTNPRSRAHFSRQPRDLSIGDKKRPQRPKGRDYSRPFLLPANIPAAHRKESSTSVNHTCTCFTTDQDHTQPPRKWKLFTQPYQSLLEPVFTIHFTEPINLQHGLCYDFNVSFLGPTGWRVCASQPYGGNCELNSSDFLWEREIPAFRGTPESATYLWSPPHNDP